MKFKELLVTSHFSTKDAHYIKTTRTKAIVIGRNDDSELKIGDTVNIIPNKTVIKLYDDMEGR